MSRIGSDRASPGPLPAAFVPLVVLAGIAAMLALAPRVAALGLRPGLMLSELALVTPGLLTLLLLRRPWRPLLGRAPGRSREWLLFAGSGAGLWIASLGLFELQYSVWPPPEGYLEAFRLLHDRLRPNGAVDAGLSLLAIAIAPAICEEILFRGLVLPSLIRPLGVTGAILGSALLFGLIHLDATTAGALSLYRVPFAFAVGIGFGMLRLASGGLAAPAVAHATLNGITFLAAPLTDDPAAGLPDPRPLLGALMLGGGLLLAIFLLRLLTRRAAIADEAKQAATPIGGGPASREEQR